MNKYKRMLNHRLYASVGELYARKRAIEKLIEDIELDISNSHIPNESHSLYGRLDAAYDCRNSKHSDIIDRLIETKMAISELAGIENLLEELEYKKGYVQGLEDILKIDRQIFKELPTFVFFIYSTEEELYHKYSLAFSTSKEFEEYGSGGRLSYYISTSISDICEKIGNVDTENIAVICVIYSQNVPTKEEMQKLSFEKNDNVFLIKDKDELNAENIIKKVIKTTII